MIFASWGSEGDAAVRCLARGLGWKTAWPLAKTCTLNMDMIGRSEEVPEFGGRRFNGLADCGAERQQR
jgi:hypothetical protein